MAICNVANLPFTLESRMGRCVGDDDTRLLGIDTMDPRLIDVFFEVQRGLPRQGPGNRESTLQALGMCDALPPTPNVLDVGCGPGMQTLTLAEACRGSILAIDTCEEYLLQLSQRASQQDLVGQIEVQHADMRQLDLEQDSLDLIWCEGAAYILGIADALRSWKSFLRPSGYLAFTELVWLDATPRTTEPSSPVRQFFQTEYPAMTDPASIRNVIANNSFELMGDFTLPDAAWWDDYYRPLAAKLPALRKKYKGDSAALDVITMTETEIDMRRRFGDTYGYQFFVCQKR